MAIHFHSILDFLAVLSKPQSAQRFADLLQVHGTRHNEFCLIVATQRLFEYASQF